MRRRVISRRLFLSGLAGVLATPTTFSTSLGKSLCEGWSQSLVWDFRHALSGAVTNGSFETTVYLAGATWCPYTKKLVAEYLASRQDFGLRIIPFDNLQASHRRQAADIILHGPDGVRRTFIDEVAPPELDPAVVKFLNDANLVAAESYKPRFPQELVSPTMLYENRRGAGSINGYIPLADLPDDLTAVPYVVQDLSIHINTIMSMERKLPVQSNVRIKRPAAIHALPYEASAALGCSSSGTRYTAVSNSLVDGLEWVKIIAFETTHGEAIFAYAKATDLTA